MNMHPRSLALLTLVSALVLSAGVAPAGDPAAKPDAKPGAAAADTKVAAKEPIEWLSFSDGLKLAHEKKKPVLVDIYTSWCGWCRRMDLTTYKDEKIIQALNENFVVVKMNAESNT